MGRYTGSVCRLCRREGEKLYLKADRCYSEKCAVEKKPQGPGQRTRGRRRKTTEYGLQLREKQKAKRFYGVLERQFRNYFKRQSGSLSYVAPPIMLERRLDNVVYRLGFAVREKRLLITMHFTINGRKAIIPSCWLKWAYYSGKKRVKNRPNLKRIRPRRLIRLRPSGWK